MASIQKKGNSYYVVYMYIDETGKKKQKWESCETLADAKRRQTEVAYKEQNGTFVVPNCRTLSNLLEEYIGIYGKSMWSLSYYQTCLSLIRNYITPYIGETKISEISTHMLDHYYQELLKKEAAPRMVFGALQKKGEPKLVSASTVRDVHKVLRSCLKQAVKWGLLEHNPAENTTVPKHVSEKRDIWTAETVFRAIENCESDRLKLALNLAFSDTLRIGELLALTWDCVHVSPEEIASGSPYIYINKELQRVKRSAISALDGKDVIYVFPSMTRSTESVLVLKTTKTESSKRKIYLPETVAAMLVRWKEDQESNKEALGSEYQDFNLVFAGALGNPIDPGTIRKDLKKLIEDNGLPPVVFHSLRHSSVTTKLKLSGGDVKSVQGDSGHAQSKMVTDLYAHILDDDRRINAQRIEEAFYSGKKAGEKVSAAAEEATRAAEKNGIDPAQLAKLLSDPAAVELIRSLIDGKK